MKTVILLLSMAIAALLATGSVAAAGAKPLVVGMELAYPPFEMTDTSGKPAGVSVDLATDLAKSLGRPVVIQNISFDGLIPALKTGKVDLVISSMTATSERAKSIDFSDPYLATGPSDKLGKATLLVLDKESPRHGAPTVRSHPSQSQSEME